MKRPAFLMAAGLAVVGAACSGSLGTGGSPTTTATPMSAPQMCTRGQNVFSQIDELDNKKPEYLDEVKKAMKSLGERPAEEINDDVKAFVAYVQSATDKAQLASFPADMRVSISRIDQWWQRNCGKTLIGG
jgi:hypothetical protein